MPYILVKSGKNSYSVFNEDKKIFKSINTTYEKAVKQINLLNYIDRNKYKNDK